MATKLPEHTEEVHLSLEEARELIDVLDSEDFDDVMTALDNAQGEVKMGKHKQTAVVIYISE